MLDFWSIAVLSCSGTIVIVVLAVLLFSAYEVWMERKGTGKTYARKEEEIASELRKIRELLEEMGKKE